LRPVILEDRGLDAALSAVIARCPFPVSVTVDVDPRPSASVESAAYFAVSEALANTMRHAQATSASVIVRGDEKSLTVEVADNGRGGAAIPLPVLGNSSAVPAPPGLDGSGLAGLDERARALGGRLVVNSPPGGPTNIRVELPCG
jgi:signal transduction histidine kinase